MKIKERPILFSGPMVRAILEGRKTQTRRVVKFAIPSEYGFKGLYETPQGWQFHYNALNDPSGGWLEIVNKKCPYGKVGDRLWVRETWRPDVNKNDISGYLYKADDCFIEIENNEKAANQWLFLRKPEEQWPVMKPPVWRPSIHMPRVASRLLLEIVNVRVERLQDISEGDAIAEGCEPWMQNNVEVDSAVSDFAQLWDSINRDRGYGWDTNPWVWAVEFKILLTKQ